MDSTTKLNDFVRQNSDKFSGQTLTRTWSNGPIRLCHQSSEGGDVIFLYLKYSRLGSPQFGGAPKQPGLDKGELFILLNGNKRYSLQPHVLQPPSCEKDEQYFNSVGLVVEITWTECIAYELSKDILYEMVNATNIELKITGDSVSEVLEEHKDQISFIMMAKALYNAVFDNSMFLEDLQKEQKRVDGASKILKEWDELKDLCEKNRYKMGAFYGKEDCSFDTSAEEIIHKFGDYKAELYKQLNYCIPLYKKLHSHIYEFNTNFPNENISVEHGAGSEETIGQFIKTLEAVRNQVSFSVVTKRILIVTLIVVIFIILYLLFS